MPSHIEESDDDTYQENPTRASKSKRRKANNAKVIPEAVEQRRQEDVVTMKPLLDVIQESHEADEESSFEAFMDVLLPEYLRDRSLAHQRQAEKSQDGDAVRPMTKYERSLFINESQSKLTPDALEAMIHRKLNLSREKRINGVPEARLEALSTTPATPLPPSPAVPAVNPEVIDALYSIRTTPYQHSFLSRLHGSRAAQTEGLIAVDWETRPPWMDLMSDIRAHHALAHPERELVVETEAPIQYVSLHRCHLDQVHDLLARAFWSGIDVSDSLQYSPEKCTVVATYKKLVVGAAFLSSPQETYITYLAVKSGWENSQIATSMLYHLITLNPNRDITLHVSVNNSAMLLYNRFGFKAEEFVAGFYDAYLDPQSRASKNAFRLRLRR